ncbi:MAG: hypothetical protein KDB80_12400, partial [Planctomycetes bacterium]|nr:hypothetical protein [Planctomycetota bacterium]
MRTTTLSCVLLSGLALNVSIHAQGFEYPTFGSTTGLTLNGNAFTSASEILFGTLPGEVGSVWRTPAQPVAAGFTTTFDFDMVGSGFGGFAFVVQNNAAGASALGANEEGLGYDGLDNLIAVEFDTIANPAVAHDLGLPNPHVAIHRNLPGQPNLSAPIASAGVGILTAVSPRVRIDYVPGTLTVFYGGSVLLSVPLDLGADLSLAAGNAFVGFTGSTSSIAPIAVETRLQSWYFSPLPPPQPSSPFGFMRPDFASPTGLVLNGNVT